MIRFSAQTSRQTYFLVDAFTDRPFAGNPAAVVPLGQWKEDSWLQDVAREMNQSETAYLVPNSRGYDLRWFTPKVEVDLCGHATLASAAVLASENRLAEGATVAFATLSGELRATRLGSRFALDFPIESVVSCPPPDGLLEALQLSPSFVGRNRLDFLLELDSEKGVRSVSPDFKRLAAVSCRGVIVTSRSDEAAYDFVSRFFAPAQGIDEDPVTGSAHCALGDYWGKKLSKQILIGRQISSRGGVVHVEVLGQRVMLGGEAIVVARGELLVD
jgi:predicted PhzF superfamily epimerase YddE/YHI9